MMYTQDYRSAGPSYHHAGGGPPPGPTHHPYGGPPPPPPQGPTHHTYGGPPPPPPGSTHHTYGGQPPPPPGSTHHTYGGQPPPPPPPGAPPGAHRHPHYDIRGSTRGAPSTVSGPNPGFDRDRDGYRDGAWGYRCRFLGSKSMGAAEPQPEMVGSVVDSLIEYYKNTEVQPRRYLIRIKSQILELEELENDEVHIQNVPLDAITFCASDNRYPRIFTFVARAETGYMCHVFYCRHVHDVDRLTKDFDDAFRNCYAEWQKGGTVTSATTGITDPAVQQAVEAALVQQRPSRYRANVKEILVEDQPRSLPLYNFQGQRMKPARGRASTSGEASSTRYIFAYEDDDDDDSTVHVRRERKSHRYPVNKEQFRFSGADHRSSSKRRDREYRRDYVVQGAGYAAEQQQGTRREYVLSHAVPSTSAASVRSGVPASYRTEFVEADGRAYNREFYEADARPVTVVQTHPVPAADGPATSVIVEGDIGYGRRDYGSVRLAQTVDAPPHPAYAVHAASNDRSDMLY
ncbi:uncharacterized protein [Amphiura filiformis]|uniref:uncharacterized protein n=1 Tax=Amphiura filiformis TaxID=82378 RepID=UPI003B215939